MNQTAVILTQTDQVRGRLLLQETSSFDLGSTKDLNQISWIGHG